MKLLIPTIAFACALVGCGASESTSSTAMSTSEMKMEQKKCSACATMVASSDAVEKDGKTYCKACAEAH
jgi:hypothetical protein